MKVIAVGSSCTWFKRLNTSFIIDDNFLFDVPCGNYKPIIGYVDVLDIDYVFISHFHYDHFVDLTKITTQFIRKKPGKKLKIFAPKGILERIIQFNEIMCAAKDELSLELLKGAVDFVQIHDGMELEIGEYHAKVYRMMHGDTETYGLTLCDKRGNTIGFSADTTDCKNLREMLGSCNAAFVDMASMAPNKSHISTEQFVSLERKFDGCKMIAVHTSDETFEFANKNGLSVAHDGQIFNF